MEGWTVSVDGILGGRACDGGEDELIPAAIKGAEHWEGYGQVDAAVTAAAVVVAEAALLTRPVCSICWIHAES